MAEQHLTADTVTIGRLSYLADVGVDTVRYYERSGLLEPRRRTKTGYRLYSRSTIARIHFIRRARDLGLTVDQIRTILKVHDEGGSTADIKNFAENMAMEIDEQMRGLSLWKMLLGQLIEHCDTDTNGRIEPVVLQALMRSQCSKARH